MDGSRKLLPAGKTMPGIKLKKKAL